MSNVFYVSVDIETDGPAPGLHSMLSLGASVINDAFEKKGTFYKTMHPLPGATQHPKTMEFWADNPQAWKEATESPVDPKAAIASFVSWLKSYNGTLVPVGHPITFDLMFITWYCHKFAKEAPLGFAGFDMKTFASAVLDIPFHHSKKGYWPSQWFNKAGAHTHNALEDAIEQQNILIAMMKQNSWNHYKLDKYEKLARPK